MTRDRPPRKRRPPRMPHTAPEPTNAEEAARSFQARTGVDLATEPALKIAANMALAAAMFSTVARLEKWAKPIRQALRREPEPPTLPTWFANVSEVVRDPSRSTPVIEMAVTDESGTTASKTDLVALATAVTTQVDSLRRSLGVINATLRTVEMLDQQLRAVQQDPRGRSGSFIEPARPSRPTDEAKLRFARRFHREWIRAGREEPGATEVALAAVYVGLDDLSAGMPTVTARWATQIRRDKARSKKLLAAEKKAGRGRVTRQRPPDR